MTFFLILLTKIDAKKVTFLSNLDIHCSYMSVHKYRLYNVQKWQISREELPVRIVLFGVLMLVWFLFPFQCWDEYHIEVIMMSMVFSYALSLVYLQHFEVIYLEVLIVYNNLLTVYYFPDM